ncbi:MULTISPECIES: hypothetical protein [unclassified Sinorhizobium]|uniref:hypothetical protein n=1 Tax=unclassified Sinorhizobium TaxID=2613772 RepID=UPI0024C3A55D|nr:MULTISPECIES: hypothetical protein [unclassified Sinorhizobium]MDK1374970.1 hypothetical protein [Sinorhizobium sp. 6-70]MDK1482777.1 hypothetical protein [Sinorhizobium sp. 6-117]
MQSRVFEALLSRYETVALIANSEGVDVDAVVRALPERTLYVFFTGCAKVLTRPFDGDAVLCHRLIADGTRFLKSRKHFDRAYSLFSQPPKAEIGVLADRGVPEGAPRVTTARTSTLVPYTLDFDHALGPLYPVDRMPTTGFAVALWLVEKVPDANVSLCGFTGTAGLQFNMYSEHDWTFEQIMLQLLAQKGRIQRFEDSLCEPAGALARIIGRFPEFDEATIALVAANVLANRLTGTERQVSRLWARTKLERNIRAFFKRFRH